MALKIAYRNTSPENQNLDIGDAIFRDSSDAEIWRHLKTGNIDAMSFIYKVNFFKLFNYGIKISQGNEELTKDAIQEVFIRIWNHRTTLADVNNIKFYLFKSIRREIVQKLGKISKKTPLEDAPEKYFELVPSHEQVLTEEVDNQEKRKQVLFTINALPLKQREIIFLKYYENLDAREIANVMSIKRDSVYVLLSRAVSVLRKNLEQIVSIALLTLCY